MIKKLSQKKIFFRYSLLFSLGGIGYCLLEILWRGYTHPTMMPAGGICFLLYYKLCEDEKKMPLYKKCLLGAILICCVELVFGTAVNIMFRWNVWDYQTLPLNFHGQICLRYFCLWFLLCIPLTWICRHIQQKS